MTDHALHIRDAVIEDAATLYHWDEKPHVMAAVSNSGATSFEADWEDELSQQSDLCRFYIAVVDGLKIGALQIIDPAKEPFHYWGPVASDLRAIDIWIGEEAYLGRGYGTKMMTWAIERCFHSVQVQKIIIDPLSNNLRAHKFYKCLGFEYAGTRRFDAESDCVLFALTRARWEAG